MSIVKGYQITARLAEFGEWEQVDSPELDITMDDYYPPGARTPQKLISIGKFTDITLGRAYDPSRDSTVEDYVQRTLNGQDASGGARSLTIFVFNDQNILQTSKTYKVFPIGTKPPAGKNGDGGISEFVLKLAVEAKI